ncbi:putative lipoyltransferase 2, mitochondrial isoform X2 [Branchiostoma floridae]|uniref:Octanoyl-[acyl-carrier-protein]:protein N-octanoyltransferase LIPT2, mitochondrial n=1 Tax=Branchiostoma floridae TaxID=7739 RepID=A0A9J7HMV4_BRAFL|nr:putative lipoyltransferase 2, mitochondrial isoform X2 [Branchiostoma floridae]
MNRVLYVRNLGRISYSEGLRAQEQLQRQHLDGLAGKTSEPAKDTLLLCEHHPVYTTGHRTGQYSDSEEDRLKKLGAEFHRKSMKWYICQLEKSVIRTCQSFGIQAQTSPDTGVWVGDRKICAVGVHGSRFITTHGFALNCNPDMTWFRHIVPCGIVGKGVTSLSMELGYNIKIQDAIPTMVASFAAQFDCSEVLHLDQNVPTGRNSEDEASCSTV